MNGYNAWGALGSGGQTNGVDEFSGRLGAMQQAPAPMEAPKKGGGLFGNFNPLGSDPLTSLLTTGTWKGPGGEFKSDKQKNQFIDLRGGGRPISSHDNFLGHWGAGADDYQNPDDGYGPANGGFNGMWK